jgi:hypothetical protein
MALLHQACAPLHPALLASCCTAGGILRYCMQLWVCMTFVCRWQAFVHVQRLCQASGCSVPSDTASHGLIVHPSS